jgi:hypothetical protein
MKQEHFPFGERPRITPGLIDFYVARAREERAKAIAGFGRRLATLLSGVIGQPIRRRLWIRPRHFARTPTA